MWDLLGIRISLHTLFCLSLNVSTYDLEICLKREIKVVLLFFFNTLETIHYQQPGPPSPFWSFNLKGPLRVSSSSGALYSLRIGTAGHC